MKIKSEKEPLLKALQTLQGVISTKATLPILANLLIEGKEDKIQLSATDLDVSLSISLPVEIMEAGKGATVSARRFFDIVKNLPDGDVRIIMEKDDSVSIKAQKCFFRLKGLPKDDFPKIPELEKKFSFDIDQRQLKHMLNLTAFAVSSDTARYALNGVLFVIKNNSIRLVATDGRRLALFEKDTPAGFEKKAIVSAKAVQELICNLADEGIVTINFGENQAAFQFGRMTLISRLIEGEFPNYEGVIPKEVKNKASINRERILWAAKRSAILTSPDSQSIKLDIFKDKLIFSKNNSDMGEAREEIDIKYDGEKFSAGFNPHYLIDCLKNIKDQDVVLQLNGPENPGVIRAGNNYTYVILPMQL